MKQERYLHKLGLILIVGATFLFLFSLLADVLADFKTKRVIEELDAIVSVSYSVSLDEEICAIDKPEYLLTEDYPMPVLKVEEGEYVGILEIPAISLKQGILNEWDEDLGKREACRFRGSIYRENIVIIEPTFGRQIKRIKSLRYGDPLIFHDLAGNVFSFEVKEIEVLPSKFIDKPDNYGYPLTILLGNGNGKYTIVRGQ